MQHLRFFTGNANFLKIVNNGLSKASKSNLHVNNYGNFLLKSRQYNQKIIIRKQNTQPNESLANELKSFEEKKSSDNQSRRFSKAQKFLIACGVAGVASYMLDSYLSYDLNSKSTVQFRFNKFILCRF